MNFLCLTHSSRKFFNADASFNMLEMRFSDTSRLDRLPPFESLSNIEQAVPYDGALTVWHIDEGTPDRTLRFLFRYEPGYKVQSAAFHESFLIVYGSDRLEVLNYDLEVVRTIRHPLIAGGHTVFIDDAGHAVVTGAPANSVFRIDLDSGEVIERIAMPERYGTGYPIEGKDLHTHYIPTDCQPTHVNCAFPTADGILVTLLIQGAVGLFDRSGGYQEIVKGFRGCHGAKRFEELLYLSDSSAGTILYLDPITGAIRKRLHANTRWLHDAEHIDRDRVAVALSDSNELRILDALSGEVLQSIDCTAYGESIMFVSSFEVSNCWSERYQPKRRTTSKQSLRKGGDKGPELLGSIINYRAWSLPGETSACAGSIIRTTEHQKHAYLLVGQDTLLTRGRYCLSAEIHCREGSVMLGLLDIESDQWMARAVFDSETPKFQIDVSISKSMAVRPILTAADQRTGNAIIAEIDTLSLRRYVRKKNLPKKSALKERISSS